jgi:protease-4
MGRMAASGGYWISTPADTIYAEPTTVTGSIGVFAIFMNLEKLAADWGVHEDVVQTSPYASLFSAFQQKGEPEIALVRHVVDGIYERFITLVSEGRKLDKAHVAEIAQGRVWSGFAGKRIGLVDEIGGLEEAVKQAASLAKIENYRVEDVGATLNFADQVNLVLHTHASAPALPGFAELRGSVSPLERMAAEKGPFARVPFISTLAW